MAFLTVCRSLDLAPFLGAEALIGHSLCTAQLLLIGCKPPLTSQMINGYLALKCWYFKRVAMIHSILGLQWPGPGAEICLGASSLIRPVVCFRGKQRYPSIALQAIEGGKCATEALRRFVTGSRIAATQSKVGPVLKLIVSTAIVSFLAITYVVPRLVHSLLNAAMKAIRQCSGRFQVLPCVWVYNGGCRFQAVQPQTRCSLVTRPIPRV